MTTATETPTAAKPTTRGLVIGTPFPVEDDARAALDAYHVRCCEFEGIEAELQADWQQLTVDGLDMTVRDVIERRDELVAQKQPLEESLTRLRWEFVDVLPKMLPSAMAHVAEAKAAWEKAVTDEMQSFRDTGAADAMPAAGSNPVAAERQLRIRVEQQEWNLAMKGAVKRAEDYVNVLKSQMGIPVTPKRCQIILPIPADTHEAVRRLLA